MPRFPRTYTKTIVKKPKKNYNRQHIYGGPISSSFSGNSCIWETLVYNKIDTLSSDYTPSPGVIKATKLRAQCQCTFKSNIQEMTTAKPVLTKAYIIYCPQIVGTRLQEVSQNAEAQYNLLRNLVMNNPEYIMGQKLVNNQYQGGIPGEIKTFSFVVTSGKMSRNLKSGDRIILFFEMRPLAASQVSYHFYGEYEASVCDN